MKSFTCPKCNGVYASSQSLWNHRQRCKAVAPVKDNNHQRPNDSQLSRFIDNIINNKPQDDNTIIQPLKSSSMSNTEKHMVHPSLSVRDPVQTIMSVHETAKKLNIIPKSDERPAIKKRKLKVNDNVSDKSAAKDDAQKLKDRLSSLMLLYFNAGQYYHLMEIISLIDKLCEMKHFTVQKRQNILDFLNNNPSMVRDSDDDEDETESSDESDLIEYGDVNDPEEVEYSETM